MPKRTQRTAASEAFFQWLRFHEAFNRMIKTTTGALYFTLSEVENDLSGKRLAKIITDTGEPWGNNNRWNPKAEMSYAIRRLSELGIVAVWSAFEQFITDIEGDHASWSHHVTVGTTQSRTQETSSTEAGATIGDTEKFQRFLRRHNNLGPEHSYLLSVYNFFDILRHCVVHRDGRPSPKLHDYTVSPDFAIAWAAVQVSPRHRENPAPPILTTRQVILAPRHVLFFLAVCHCLAISLNRWVITFLGTEGFVYRASKIAFDIFPDTTIPARPEGVINAYLNTRHFDALKSPTDVVAILKRLDRWEACRVAHRNLRETSGTA